MWSSTRAAPADGTADVATSRAELSALFPPTPRIAADEGVAAYHAWERGTTAVASDHELFNLVVKRSVSDLRLLMNDGPAPGERYVAAGVPWFSTLFGRDALITAFQALPFRPQLAVETLSVLAGPPGDARTTRSRDAEPGKILHELRTGEMARAGELPHTPYFGSVDATPLWLVLLGATFDWTGDRALLDRLWPNALAALDWIDRYGDRDGDGFVEYERRSDRGLVNQGWKDSSDAIRDRTGREAVAPIALAEVQGYVFDAKRRLARLARVRGDDDAGRPARGGRRAAAHAVRGGVLGRGPALLRDGARPRQATGRRDRLQRGPVPVVRDRVARAGTRRRRPPLPAWRCSPAGASGPMPPTSPATTRSAITPARSGRTTRR